VTEPPVSRGDPAVEVHRSPGVAPGSDEVEAALRAEGLTAHAWADAPGFAYARHTHEYHKVLYCVGGAIVFHTDDGDVALAPGDRLELPAGTGHAATVGEHGVECVEAFRRQR